jgi:UDP-N-acetylglucosamine 2-epimerase (non-hydrolysing)
MINKILTLVGTRPELIRLSIIIKKLDINFENIFVYTNQNYDHNLSTKFFQELKIRKPDYIFNQTVNGFSNFLSNGFLEIDSIIEKENPSKVLILGDTNSGLLGLIAAKHRIPIYHMEAGNRCYNDLVPEEMNRKIIDSFSTYNLPYSESSKNNLLSEGYHKNKVFKIGNPIYEVLSEYRKEIDDSNVLKRLDLNKDYILITLHRSENVDNIDTLSNIVNSINIISEKIDVVLSLHPRTKDKLKKFNLFLNQRIIVSEPFGFFDFVKLEKNAKVVLSDSGTVQEECCILGVPCIILRDSTERHETIECGATILSGTKSESIVQSFNFINDKKISWVIPNDYDVPNVSDVVLNIISGKI